MTSVFAGTLEQLWLDQYSKASRAFWNLRQIYENFRAMPDQRVGLRAAKNLPSYLDVPLTGSF